MVILMRVAVGVVVSAEAVIGDKNICLHWFAVKKNPEPVRLRFARRGIVTGISNAMTRTFS